MRNKPESRKKSFHLLFHESELKMTIKNNLQFVDYLIITFSLISFDYRPLTKQNNENSYICKKSNYQSFVTKRFQLSATIVKQECFQLIQLN